MAPATQSPQPLRMMKNPSIRITPRPMPLATQSPFTPHPILMGGTSRHSIIKTEPYRLIVLATPMPLSAQPTVTSIITPPISSAALCDLRPWINPATSPNNGVIGGDVSLLGCGFGSPQGTSYVQLTTPATMMTSSGSYSQPPIQIEQVISWDYQKISFTIPQDVPPGSYSVAVVSGTQTSNALAMTIAPAPSANSSEPVHQVNPQTTIGIIDQTGQFKMLSPIGVLFGFPNGCCLTTDSIDAYGNPLPSGQTYASLIMNAVLPMLAYCENDNAQTNTQMQSWADDDTLNKQPGTPDGYAGRWGPLGSPVPCTSPGAGGSYAQRISWVSLNLNSGSNYLRQVVTYPGDTGVPGKIIEVVVVPFAKVQLNAVPYTIIYQPPGDVSTASLAQSVTNTVQYSAGSGMAVSNSATDGTNTCFALNLVAVNGSNCDQFSTTTANGFAQSSGASAGSTSSNTNVWPSLKNHDLIPGQYGSYWDEPFWSDQIVFLLKPEYAVFDNGGLPVYRLVPGPSGYGSLPVAMLAACATGQLAPTGHGLSTQTNPCNIGKVTLQSWEAASALQLDPFYPGGQSVDPSTIGGGTRASLVEGNSYGENGPPPGINTTYTFTASTQVDTANTFLASITSAHTTKVGGIASYSGVALSGNTSNTNSNTNSTTLTYQTSTVATTGTSTMNQAIIQDCDNTPNGSGSCAPCNACHPPISIADQFSVNIYEDDMFSSQMFVDPQAPPEPRDFSQLLNVHLPTILLRIPHPPAP